MARFKQTQSGEPLQPPMIMSSQQLWMPEQNLHKIKPIDDSLALSKGESHNPLPPNANGL
ncbi:hypothetical protein STEG23_011634, partial [Scotinomys teguina]